MSQENKFKTTGHHYDFPDYGNRWIKQIHNNIFIPFVAQSPRYTNYKSLTKNGNSVSGVIKTRC